MVELDHELVQSLQYSEKDLVFFISPFIFWTIFSYSEAATGGVL